MSDSNRALKASWTANAEAWTQAVRQGAIESRRAATDAAVVNAATEARSAGRVLDLGCGEGWLARELTRRGYTVTGIDASVPLIERALELGGGEFTVLSYEEIAADPGVLGGPYDEIICNFSLLGEEIRGLLAALRLNLAPGGALVIQTLHPYAACGTEPYRDGWRLETFAGMGEGFREPMPWFFRTIGSWHAALREVGFHVTTLKEPVHPETGRPLSLILTGTVTS